MLKVRSDLEWAADEQRFRGETTSLSTYMSLTLGCSGVWFKLLSCNPGYGAIRAARSVPTRTSALPAKGVSCFLGLTGVLSSFFRLSGFRFERLGFVNADLLAHQYSYFMRQAIIAEQN